METMTKEDAEQTLGRLEKRKSLYGFETRVPDKRFTERNGSPNIKSLWQRSHEIIGLALQGHKNKDIALLLNINPCTVSNTLNSELGEKKLSELREKRDEGLVEVSKEVVRLSEKALEVYEEIFDSETVSYNLKKDAADTVLMDLGGHRSPTKVDTRSLHMTATPDEIAEFKRLGLAAAKESGYLIDLGEDNEPKKITE